MPFLAVVDITSPGHFPSLFPFKSDKVLFSVRKSLNFSSFFYSFTFTFSRFLVWRGTRLLSVRGNGSCSYVAVLDYSYVLRFVLFTVGKSSVL